MWDGDGAEGLGTPVTSEQSLGKPEGPFIYHRLHPTRELSSRPETPHTLLGYPDVPRGGQAGVQQGRSLLCEYIPDPCGKEKTVSPHRVIVPEAEVEGEVSGGAKAS